MTTLPLSSAGNPARSAARKQTRLWQVAGVALVLLALALVLLPVSGALAPDVPTIKPAVRAATPPPAPTISTDSISGAASILSALNPRTPITPPETQTPDAGDEHAATEPATDETQPDAAPAPAPTIQWGFLGSIVSPKTTYALVRIGGTGEQALMALNDVREGWTLKEVYADHIIMASQAGELVRIDLLPPTHTWPQFGPGKIPESAITTGAAPSSVARPAPTPGVQLHPAATAAAGAAIGQPFGPKTDGIVIRPYDERPPIILPPGTPASIDPILLEALISKVARGDAEPTWVVDSLKSMGLDPNASLQEKIEFFDKINVPYEGNSDFIDNLDQIASTPVTRKDLEGMSEQQRAEVLAREDAERERAREEQRKNSGGQ